MMLAASKFVKTLPTFGRQVRAVHHERQLLLRRGLRGEARYVNRATFANKASVGPKVVPSRFVVLAGGCALAVFVVKNEEEASCDAKKGAMGDVVMLGPTAEPVTGILFPRLCNGLTFVGCGVRVKWRFVKVYAVGTYIDPVAFAYVKNRSDEDIVKALLDPKHPRTIRVVMNRSVSIEKYTSAIIEALEPRMKGEDLDKLEEFKKLNPPGDLVEGAVMEMTVRGDTLLYRNSAGNVGAIHSEVFCRALCDVYYGADAVSEAHKADVIKGIQQL